MINTIRGKTFNIPTNIFRQDNFFVSFARMGPILKEGFVNPDSANAISKTKLLSVKKAYSEVIERRALMIGGIPLKNGMVETYDMITKKSSLIPKKLTTYSTEKDFPIDTTGTAAHFQANEALKNALKELLEKNSLFLFWYGNFGYRIEKNPLQSNEKWKYIIESGYKVDQYFNDYFSPFFSVLTVIQKDGIIFSAGMGFDLNLLKTLSISLDEAFLLLWQNKMLEVINDVTNKSEPINYLEQTLSINKLLSYPSINIEKIIWETKNIQHISIQKILNSYPKWVKELHVVYLKQELDPRLTCIKVVTRNLYNHVPIKEYLNLDNDINRNTIMISQDHLETLPNCIFV